MGVKNLTPINGRPCSSTRYRENRAISRRVCVDHCILLLKHLSNHMYFTTNGYKCFSKTNSKKNTTCATRVFFLPLISRNFFNQLISHLHRFVILCICWQNSTVFCTKSSFSYSSPSLWNNLPHYIQTTPNEKIVKHLLKTYLFTH